MRLAMVMLPALWVATYTFNYGRWAWKRNLRFGAVGLMVLATMVVAAPVVALWVNL